MARPDLGWISAGWPALSAARPTAVQREWEKARNDFFEAFKNYDEAGVQRRVQCLKYLVLANMLMNSDINPFDSQEAKPYKNDPEIVRAARATTRAWSTRSGAACPARRRLRLL